MINIQRQSGFSAVELLITLFIAAVFLMTGFQLYAVIIKNGGDARQQSSAANVAADYLQQYESSATSPCTPGTPLTGQAVTGAGLSNATVTVTITCPNIPVSSFSATGGTITKNNGYTIHTFTSSGTFTVVNGSNNIDVLVVGGGGGGGNTGSGGGAGGYVYKTNYSVSTNPYIVTVGAGGNSNAVAGTNSFKGSDSFFNDITAEGGGYGASHSCNNNPGGNGGSGGGGAIRCGVAGSPGGTASSGNIGGTGMMAIGWVGGSGGGGGAGSAGSDGTDSPGSGNGGAGLSNSISGTAVTYAGGGGGGEVNGTYVGIGGSNIGGTAVANAVGGNGVTNTGSGGAGGSYNAAYYIGGTGGSGIVIVRYPTPNPTTLTNVSKVTVSVKYGNSQQIVNNSTYVSTQGIVTKGLTLNLDAGSMASYPAGGPTWTDLSPNGINGTLINGPTYNSANSGSIVFDGVNDYVNVGNGTSLDITGAITLEGWIKLSTIAPTQSLFIKSNTSGTLGNTSYGISVNPGGTLSTILYSNTDVVNFTTSSQYIYSGNWYNVSITWDGSTSVANNTSTYVNGVLVQSFSKTSALNSNTQPLTIGSMQPSPGYNPLNGNIGVARIYNRALSSNEVTQNFNALKGRYGL